MEAKEKKESKDKRTRRKKHELNRSIWNAVEQLVKKVGFNAITLTRIAEEAGVHFPVIYNRFSDLEDLLEEYARKNDYWLKDRGLVEIDEKRTPVENFKKMLVALINELYDNEIMQKFLIWELNDTHNITRHVAQFRESDSFYLLGYLNKWLNNNGFNFDVLNGLMISGIYYLIIHRKISIFSNIDYNTKEGKKLLIESVEKIVDRIFFDEQKVVEKSEKKLMRTVAFNMLKKHFDKKTIKDITGLSIKRITEIERETEMEME